MTINWFPGHMVKARREIAENLKLVDVVVVILDARAPNSCINPELEKMIGRKKILYVLNKSDLAEKTHVKAAIRNLQDDSRSALAASSTRSKGITECVDAIQALFKDRQAAIVSRGRRPRAVRAMVVGLPNVGKSSFLNSVIGKGIAITGPKPGVTRGKQWVRIRDDIELMDTPGIMWPRIDSEIQALNLALIGVIGDNAYDDIIVASYLIGILRNRNEDNILDKYGIRSIDAADEDILAALAAKRGHLQKGGVPDTAKTCQVLIQEFRTGKLGRISLE